MRANICILLNSHVLPSLQVRRMLVERDCDGLNFLMHAASCDVVATSPASGEGTSLPAGFCAHHKVTNARLYWLKGVCST